MNKAKIKNIISVICFILCILSIIATGVFIVIGNAEKSINKSAEVLTNSQSLYLMQGTSRLDILRDIYGVYNEDTYQRMKTSTKISADLRDELFYSDTYKGNYASKPSVSIANIRYNPSASALVSRYYASVTVTYENDVRSFNLLIEFVDNKLTSLEVIP